MKLLTDPARARIRVLSDSVMDLDMDTAITTVWISASFCCLVIVLWCITGEHENDKDIWFKNCPSGSEQERQQAENVQREVVENAQDKSMKTGMMLNPAYRMTPIGSQMVAHPAPKAHPERHNSQDAHVKLDESHSPRRQHSHGKDAFDKESLTSSRNIY
jgi:hypothetical protein